MVATERPASRHDAPVRLVDLAARYRSLFEIGRGGMGTIEVALELGASERIVALKRMHPGGARHERHVEMFLREARLAALLVHPNVVHAFDFGEIAAEDGGKGQEEFYLAMEYVEGEPLSEIVRAARERSPGRPLSPAIVASILADACEGLHAAHELRDPTTGAPMNVIHRDVSPHNVMVSYEGHVKLLDFGVAKIDTVDPLTRTGEVKGKTAYMSPEQAMGEELDRRSDLFSVGAVLYECVSGHRMYGGGTNLEILRKLALDEPPSLKTAAPLAPEALVDLHARLVAKKREHRPESALAVANELRAFVAASGERVNAAEVAQAMNGLFAAAASERRRRLNEALSKEVPAGKVDVLRRSLAGPTALAPRAPVPGVIADLRTPPTNPQRATRTGVAVSILAGVALAVGIVALTTARSSPPSPPATPPSSSPPPAASPTAATTNAQPAVARTASASASPSAAPPPAAASAPSSLPRRAPGHHPGSPSPSAHVDVDPNPL